MKIDKRLNLVVPVERDKITLWVHSAPISREVFDNYFLVLSKALTMACRAGGGIAPRIAYKCIEASAKELKVWDGVEGVNNGLLQEIRRLTNVLVPTATGWNTLPVDIALKQNLLSEDEYYDIRDYISFFILVSCLYPKKMIMETLEEMNSLWGSQTTSLTCMEYIASLPTAIEEPNIPMTISSVPG